MSLYFLTQVNIIKKSFFFNYFWARLCKWLDGEWVVEGELRSAGIDLRSAVLQHWLDG